MLALDQVDNVVDVLLNVSDTFHTIANFTAVPIPEKVSTNLNNAADMIAGQATSKQQQINDTVSERIVLQIVHPRDTTVGPECLCQGHIESYC